MKLKNTILLSLLPTMLFSCGPESGDSANVSVSLDNVQAALHGGFALEGTEEYVQPESFNVKIIGVELKKDDGKYVAIWVNPDCNAKKETLKDGDKEYEYYSVEGNGCGLANINTTLDISRSTEEVNAELNSQDWPVPPGTYTEVSIRMCEPGDTDADKEGAIKFKTDEMDVEYSYATATCGVTGAATGSFEISDKTSASINLEYDSTKLVSRGVHTFGDGSPLDLSDSYPSGECDLVGIDTTICGKFGAYTFSPTLISK